MEFHIAHATPGKDPDTLRVFGHVSTVAAVMVDVSGESPVATLDSEADRMSPRVKTALCNAVAEAVSVALKAKSDPRVAGESLERAIVVLRPMPRVESALAEATPEATPSPAAPELATTPAAAVATPQPQETPVQALPVEPTIATAPAAEATPEKPQEAAAPVAVASNAQPTATNRFGLDHVSQVHYSA